MSFVKTSSFYLNLISGLYDASSSAFGGEDLETYLLSKNENLTIFSDFLGERRMTSVAFSLDRSFNSILNSNTAWESVLSSNIALSVIASSPWATQRLCQEPERLASIFKYGYPNRILHWLNSPINRKHLSSQINAPNSSLKRSVFTSSGTWTKPANLHALSVSLVGGGGGGGKTSGNLNSPGGGGGGQIVTYNLTQMPTSNATLTIGSGGNGATSGSSAGGNGGSTSFSASGITTLVANGGNGGPVSGSTGGGTGGTIGDFSNYLQITEPELEFAIFQCARVSLNGGQGGSGRNGVGNGGDGGDCYPNTGGAGGGHYPGLMADGGMYGGKYSGGGGGGGKPSTSSTSVSLKDGYSAPLDNYGAGGGAGASSNSGNAGGAGAPGIAIVHWIEG